MRIPAWLKRSLEGRSKAAASAAVFLVNWRYWLYWPALRGKMREVLRYDTPPLDGTGQVHEDRAMPGFREYRANGYHRYMLGRYLFAIPFIQDRTVLEIGCGFGWGAYVIGGRARKMLCIDCDADAVAFALRTWREPRVEFRRMDASALASFPERFDTVLAYELIEHLDFQAGSELIHSIARLLNREGVVIMSSYFPQTQEEASRVAEGKSYHPHIYTKEEMIRLLGEAGLGMPRFIGDLMVVARKQS